LVVCLLIVGIIAAACLQLHLPPGNHRRRWTRCGWHEGGVGGSRLTSNTPVWIGVNNAGATFRSVIASRSEMLSSIAGQVQLPVDRLSQRISDPEKTVDFGASVNPQRRSIQSSAWHSVFRQRPFRRSSSIAKDAENFGLAQVPLRLSRYLFGESPSGLTCADGSQSDVAPNKDRRCPLRWFGTTFIFGLPVKRSPEWKDTVEKVRREIAGGTRRQRQRGVYYCVRPTTRSAMSNSLTPKKNTIAPRNKAGNT
jgi:hypothetical protein